MKEGIGTGGDMAGSGGGGEGRNPTPPRGGGNGEVVGSAGCRRRRRRRRGPGAAARRAAGGGEGPHGEVLPAAAPTARSRWAKRTHLQKRTKNGRRWSPYVRALAARVSRAQRCSEGM